MTWDSFYLFALIYLGDLDVLLTVSFVAWCSIFLVYFLEKTKKVDFHGKAKVLMNISVTVLIIALMAIAIQYEAVLYFISQATG
ncbi:MAG: hypothetical protein NXI13_07810 [Proteobacteria bacterium]|nr:hypothetical protein [Pseudomonadota bacterium]